jgi:hypothetical protein
MKAAIMLACTCLSVVMAGRSASNDARERAYVPAIDVLLEAQKEDVDARHKAGHDECGTVLS